MQPADLRILFLGAGDLGTGAAHRLHAGGFAIAVLELEVPRTVRRRVAFAEAARAGEIEVEGIRCRRVPLAALAPVRADIVPLVVAPLGDVLAAWRPAVLVDARMTKQPLTEPLPAQLFRIALGPGHTAGGDCDAVVETLRGPELGRVLWTGAAAASTHVPGEVGGETMRRVLRAPAAGRWEPSVAIGDRVAAGALVGRCAGHEVRSALAGLVRGLLAAGVPVDAGQKLGDVDPRADPPAVERISDKAQRIGAGVLDAVRARFALDLPAA